MVDLTDLGDCRQTPPPQRCTSSLLEEIDRQDRPARSPDRSIVLKFVRRRTSILVPQVYCSFIRNNCAYVVTQRMHGQDLPIAWPTLSDESRQTILVESQHVLQELRALEPP